MIVWLFMGRVGIALVLALLVACQGEHSGESAATSDESIIAVINGHPVPRSEFVDALIADEGRAYFSRFADQILVERAFAEAKLSIDEDALARAVQAEVDKMVNDRFAGNREALDAQLARYGMDFKAWKARQARDLRVERQIQALMSHEIDEVRVRALFEKRYGKGGVRRRVRQILISTNIADSRLYTRAQFENEKEAITQKARRRAAATREALVGGADFGKVAKAESDDSSASRGGDIGTAWSGRFGQAFDEAIKRLQVGQLSAVIEGRGGFHIARVTGIRKGARYQGHHIFVSAKAKSPKPPSDAERFAKALKTAQTIAAEAKSLEAFTALAKTKSEDVLSRAKGGALDPFGPGRLGAEVDAILESIQLNRVSAPLKTKDGYELVWLTKRDFLPTQDRKLVSHILFSTGFTKVKARKLRGVLETKAKAQAEAIMEQVKAKKADFAAIARKMSDDMMSRASGGVIQYRPGLFGDAFDQAVAQMKSGEIQMIRSKKGFHIIELSSISRSDFKAVQADLAAELKQKRADREQVKAYLKTMRESAKIERKF